MNHGLNSRWDIVSEIIFFLKWEKSKFRDPLRRPIAFLSKRPGEQCFHRVILSDLFNSLQRQPLQDAFPPVLFENEARSKLLKGINIKLSHLQERVYDLVPFFRISHEPWQDRRYNLPGNTVFVSEPSALLCIFITTF